VAASPLFSDHVSPSIVNSSEPDRTRTGRRRPPRATSGAPARLCPRDLTAPGVQLLTGQGKRGILVEAVPIDELERKRYVERKPHPHDAHARLVVLTDRGRRCTAAAWASAAEAVSPWEEILGERRLLKLRDELARLAPTGPLRPSW
jgi:hypothetical protein